MRVLVACEYSGRVRDAFRAHGHDAWSCDLLPSEQPGPHIQGDVLEVLGEGWDLMVAHPTCTYLCNSGVHWLYVKPRQLDAEGNLVRDPERWALLEQGAAFFRALLNAPIPLVAVENPVMHRYAKALIAPPPEVVVQTVQPYQFGHPESKATQLWLRGLPPLRPTNVLTKPERGYWENQTPSGQNKLAPSEHRWQDRSRTYEGIAAAMAEQWGGAVPHEEQRQLAFSL